MLFFFKFIFQIFVFLRIICLVCGVPLISGSATTSSPAFIFCFSSWYENPTEKLRNSCRIIAWHTCWNVHSSCISLHLQSPQSCSSYFTFSSLPFFFFGNLSLLFNSSQIFLHIILKLRALDKLFSCYSTHKLATSFDPFFRLCLSTAIFFY